MSELAIHGGPKAKPTPYHTPNRYGEMELRHLAEAIETGKLMYHAGDKVREFQEGVQKAFDVAHCVMVTSGTAAIHAAMAAIGVAEGDEVITTPMVDAGAIAGILAQHAIPIFADIDIETVTLDPEKVEPLITERTKAIMVVHMSGNVADMDAFMRIGEKHGIHIVEDCSQCHGGRWKGKVAGTIGSVGAFSMNESKHMSGGEGGFLITNDAQAADLARLFSDKTYRRKGVTRGSEPIPWLGINYRPTCLTGAMGVAQLARLPENIARRAAIAKQYYGNLADLPHFRLPRVYDGAEPNWWPMPSRYEGDTPTRDEILKALTAEGLVIRVGMCPADNMLRTELIQKKRFYPLTGRVPHFWRKTRYDPDSCPNVDRLGETALRLPVDQRYTDDDIAQTIEGFRKVWRHYFGSPVEPSA